MSIENVSIEKIGEIFAKHESFALMSHVRPDGDAIGSQLALGAALEALGKKVYYWNEDGLPESLEFLPDSNKILQPPTAPVKIDVAVALDTATKIRLGDNNLNAASLAKVWLNIDHHVSNPKYGDFNFVDDSYPATGQIVYDIIKLLDYPLNATSRDAIYVAVSTDTGSFQYDATTEKTYLMAADLISRGLQVGKINALTYDNFPLRRVELTRALLNTLEICGHGKIAHWSLTQKTVHDLQLIPDDSEGLIDMIRAIKGVIVAAFFEELSDGKIRVSLRSKTRDVNVCEIASHFGGGGHALAAGIRMKGTLDEVKEKVLSEIEKVV